MAIQFNSLYEHPKDIEQFFDDILRMSPQLQKVQYPHVNVIETNDAYVVDIMIPGVTASDLDLTLTARNLVIKGERTTPEGKYFRQERRAGTFQRVLNLNVPIDRDAVTAKSEHGIVRVTLPKSEAVEPRKITISE